jgi:hypothetical protein
MNTFMREPAAAKVQIDAAGLTEGVREAASRIFIGAADIALLSGAIPRLGQHAECNDEAGSVSPWNNGARLPCLGPCFVVRQGPLFRCGSPDFAVRYAL